MPRPPDFQYDVFLSHNHVDKPRMRRLAERLKAAGVRVWLGEGSIQKSVEVPATGQAATGAIKRRFALPYGARKARRRRHARQSNATTSRRKIVVVEKRLRFTNSPVLPTCTASSLRKMAALN